MRLETWMSGFVFVCLATRRMVFRQSVVDGRLLCWIPRALQQTYFGGNQGQSEVNTAPVNRRRRDAAVCGQTSHTCRNRHQTGRGLRSPSDVSRLLSPHGLACCCAETKLQSFKLKDMCSPRGAGGTWHHGAGKVRRCHGVPW